MALQSCGRVSRVEEDSTARLRYAGCLRSSRLQTDLLHSEPGPAEVRGPFPRVDGSYAPRFADPRTLLGPPPGLALRSDAQDRLATRSGALLRLLDQAVIAGLPGTTQIPPNAATENSVSSPAHVLEISNAH